MDTETLTTEFLRKTHKDNFVLVNEVIQAAKESMYAGSLTSLDALLKQMAKKGEKGRSNG